MSRLSALRGPVRRRLGDPDSVRWTDDTQIDFWLLRASTHFTLATRCLTKELEVTISAAGGAEYRPTGGGDESIFYIVRSIKLRLASDFEKDLEWVPSYRAGADTWITGEPRYWSTRRKSGLLYVTFYPAPDATYTTIWNGYHTAPVIGASDFTEIPVDVEDEPGYLAQAMMEAGNGDYENAMVSWNRYREGLRRGYFASRRGM